MATVHIGLPVAFPTETRRPLASDMRTTSGFLMSTRKRKSDTEFACYVRNMTGSALATLDECIRQFMSKPASQHHLYEIHTTPQQTLVTAVRSAEQVVELVRLREFL